MVYVHLGGSEYSSQIRTMKKRCKGSGTGLQYNERPFVGRL